MNHLFPSVCSFQLTTSAVLFSLQANNRSKPSKKKLEPGKVYIMKDQRTGHPTFVRKPIESSRQGSGGWLASDDDEPYSRPQPESLTRQEPPAAADNRQPSPPPPPAPPTPPFHTPPPPYGTYWPQAQQPGSITVDAPAATYAPPMVAEGMGQPVPLFWPLGTGVYIPAGAATAAPQQTTAQQATTAGQTTTAGQPPAQQEAPATGPSSTPSRQECAGCGNVRLSLSS